MKASVGGIKGRQLPDSRVLWRLSNYGCNRRNASRLVREGIFTCISNMACVSKYAVSHLLTPAQFALSEPASELDFKIVKLNAMCWCQSIVLDTADSSLTVRSKKKKYGIDPSDRHAGNTELHKSG